ncbi:hypothetical protein N9382_00445, partial [bacterium]|nr:hypothetical protein [bacterium]
MKKKILIISGGISKERLISLDTGLQVAKELKKNGYKVKISEPDNQLARNINQFKPNVIFNALHGQFGEDGYIQTILEGFKIPYTHSGTVASALAMDKEISKKIFIKNKITTPKFIKYSYEKNNLDLIKIIEKKLKFPVILKPINEGSSVNVFICTKKNILKVLKLLESYKQIIIEEFIAGREIQVWKNEALGAEWEYKDIPDDLKEISQKYRTELVETAVEQDEKLMEAYLNGDEIKEEDLIRCIRKGT